MAYIWRDPHDKWRLTVGDKSIEGNLMGMFTANWDDLMDLFSNAAEVMELKRRLNKTIEPVEVILTVDVL